MKAAEEQICRVKIGQSHTLTTKECIGYTWKTFHAIFFKISRQEIVNY